MNGNPNIYSSYNDMPHDAKVFLMKASDIINKKEPSSNEIEELRKLYEILNKKYNIDEEKKQYKIGVMMGKIAHKFNNKYWINYTREHRKAFQETEKKLLGYNTKDGLNHDKDKEIMYHLFPAPLAHAIHTKTARHHKKRARTTADYKQMVIDWECNRLTKPDKQLKPYQVMEKFYPDLRDIIVPILREFNLPTCAAEDKGKHDTKTLTREQKNELLNMKKRLLKESVDDIKLSIYEAEMNGDISKEDMVMLFDELNYLIEKTSKKEKNRMNKFLKEHNYDPKTKTIEIDEKDKNGKKKRVKFNITNGPVFSDSAQTVISNPSVETSSINMSRKTLKRKPMISHGIFKHEEGHIVDITNPDRFKDIHDKAKKYIDDDKDNRKNEHDKESKEYVADRYSAQHSKYGAAGFNKMINALRLNDDNINKEISKIKKNLKEGKELKSDDLTDLKIRLKVCKKSLVRSEENTKKEIASLKYELKHTTDSKERDKIMNCIETFKKFGDDRIRKYKKEIEDCKKKIDMIIKLNYPADYVDKSIDAVKDRIRSDLMSNHKMDNNGLELRRKFVNDNVKESVVDIKLSIYEAEMNGDISKYEMYELLILTENM